MTIKPWIKPILYYTFATILAVIVLIPLFWMISTSFKSKEAITVLPIQWIPQEPSIEGYRKLFTLFPFSRAIFNSLWVSVLTTGVRLISASMAAYVFAKLTFRGRELLFGLFLATMMVPMQVTFIPLFLVLKKLTLLNTFTGLIIPSVFNAFAIFMLRQHMRTIDNAFIQAAVIDGASHFKIFTKIIIPLSAPILATLAIITFMEAWNDYLWPLIVLSSPEKMTLPLALSRLSGQYSNDYNTLMAGSLISIIPILIVYGLAQRYFKAGLQLGGVK